MVRNSNDDTNLIILRNIERKIQDKYILKDINLKFSRNKIYCIVGPSGAGKSSLLRLLVQLDSPTEGETQIDQRNIHDIPPLDLRKKIGFVFQIPYMFPGSVLDNIIYGPQLRNETNLKDRARELLQRVGMSQDLLSQDAESLSVGQQQRIAFARTLANNPEILLLDEPTSALDPTSTKTIERLIVDLVKNHRLTVIMVTHQLEQALRLADEIVFMVDGEIIEQNSKEGFILSQNKKVQAFLKGELK
ncbi:MAG: ABC transporter ATP-binding protein [Candidatus Helarchaeota archaeon]